MSDCCDTTPDTSTVRDPVCGMKVNPVTARHHEHRGQLQYFCSDRCRTKFIADPQRYLEPPQSPPSAEPQSAHPPQDVIYTCPMHPEVRQSGPGSCPKCGMALEPETPSTEEDDTELRDALQAALQSAIDDGSYAGLLDEYGTPQSAVEEATINGGE